MATKCSNILIRGFRRQHTSSQEAAQMHARCKLIRYCWVHMSAIPWTRDGPIVCDMNTKSRTHTHKHTYKWWRGMINGMKLPDATWASSGPGRIVVQIVDGVDGYYAESSSLHFRCKAWFQALRPSPHVPCNWPIPCLLRITPRPPSHRSHWQSHPHTCFSTQDTALSSTRSLQRTHTSTLRALSLSHNLQTWAWGKLMRTRTFIRRPPMHICIFYKKPADGLITNHKTMSMLVADVNLYL